MTILPHSPFLDSTLVLATGVESITAPDLSDRSVAVVANSDTAMVISTMSADAALDLEHTPVLVLGAVTNSSSCGGVEGHAATYRRPYAPSKVDDRAPQITVGALAKPNRDDCRMSPVNPRLAGIKPGPQDSIPQSASASPPCLRELAGVALTGTPAVFSLDSRIHKVMLALADELADELRTINEPLLLRQFAPDRERAQANRTNKQSNNQHQLGHRFISFDRI